MNAKPLFFIGGLTFKIFFRSLNFMDKHAFDIPKEKLTELSKMLAIFSDVAAKAAVDLEAANMPSVNMSGWPTLVKSMVDSRA